MLFFRRRFLLRRSAGFCRLRRRRWPGGRRLGGRFGCAGLRRRPWCAFTLRGCCRSGRGARLRTGSGRGMWRAFLPRTLSTRFACGMSGLGFRRALLTRSTRVRTRCRSLRRVALVRMRLLRRRCRMSCARSLVLRTIGLRMTGALGSVIALWRRTVGRLRCTGGRGVFLSRTICRSSFFCWTSFCGTRRSSFIPTRPRNSCFLG